MKQAVMQNLATQNSGQNFLTVILALFSSLTKRYRVAILKFQWYDSMHLLWRRRKDIAAKCFCI